MGLALVFAASLAACGTTRPVGADVSVVARPGETLPEIAAIEVTYPPPYMWIPGVSLEGKEIDGDIFLFDPRAAPTRIPLLGGPGNAIVLVEGRQPLQVLPESMPHLRSERPISLVSIPLPASATRPEAARVKYARFSPRAPLPVDAPFTITAPAGEAWRPKAAAGWKPWPVPDERIPEQRWAGAWRPFDVAQIRSVAGATGLADFATVFAVRYDPPTASGEVLWIEQRVHTNELGGPEFGSFGFPCWPGMGWGRVVDLRAEGR